MTTKLPLDYFIPCPNCYGMCLVIPLEHDDSLGHFACSSCRAQGTAETENLDE